MFAAALHPGSPAPPPPDPSPASRGKSANALARQFFGTVIDPRSYRNLAFLALALPLGLTYFVFLVCGFSIGLGLSIVWIGVPILALVLVASRCLALGERWLAMNLLGAEVPPAEVAAVAKVTAAEAGERRPLAALWGRFYRLLQNPVTWKGIAYLLLKFPLSLVTFVVTVVLLSVSGSLLAAPILYRSIDIEIYPWYVDSPGAAFVLMGVGAVLMLLSFHALNGVAWLWRRLAVAMLGSRRYAAAV